MRTARVRFDQSLVQIAGAQVFILSLLALRMLWNVPAQLGAGLLG
jgi:hypothetical protein